VKNASIRYIPVEMYNMHYANGITNKFKIDVSHPPQHSTKFNSTMVNSLAEQQPGQHRADTDIAKILALAKAVLPQQEIASLICSKPSQDVIHGENTNGK
jgi:hypothetical protein